GHATVASNGHADGLRIRHACLLHPGVDEPLLPLDEGASADLYHCAGDHGLPFLPDRHAEQPVHHHGRRHWHVHTLGGDGSAADGRPAWHGHVAGGADCVSVQ